MNELIKGLEMEPGAASIAGHRVVVTRSARGVLRYFFDGVRVDRPSLLTLLCDRDACEHRQRALARFHAFSEAPAPATPLRLRPRPWSGIRGPAGGGPAARPGAALMTPVMLADGIELRPAAYPCRVVCPMNAHPPTVQTIPGYDAFRHGRCIAGGTVASGAETRPLLATVLDATRHLQDMLASPAPGLPRG